MASLHPCDNGEVEDTFFFITFANKNYIDNSQKSDYTN